VARVAPYSSRRHPPVTDKPIKSMSLLHLKRMAIVILKQKN
jgi:hypothetical protein